MILCLVVLSRYLVGTKIPEFLALFPSLRYYLVQGVGRLGGVLAAVVFQCGVTPLRGHPVVPAGRALVK